MMDVRYTTWRHLRHIIHRMLFSVLCYLLVSCAEWWIICSHALWRGKVRTAAHFEDQHATDTNKRMCVRVTAAASKVAPSSIGGIICVWAEYSQHVRETSSMFDWPISGRSEPSGCFSILVKDQSCRVSLRQRAFRVLRTHDLVLISYWMDSIDCTDLQIHYSNQYSRIMLLLSRYHSPALSQIPTLTQARWLWLILCK